jgi:hypothetical protein
MTSKRKANVWSALKVAQQSLQAVGKGSQNSFHGYSYTSAEDMLKACRTSLLDAGLVCTRRQWNITEIAGTMWVTSQVELSLADGDMQDEQVCNSLTSEFTYPIVPANGRPVDKALSAALTTGLSYWLRDLLLLPRVDDLEVDTRDDSKYKHDEQEAISIAIEIEDRASPEQMEKLKGQFARYKATKLEDVPLVTLKAWLKRVKETNNG